MYVSPLEDTWVKSWDEPARGRNFTGAQSHRRSRNLTPWYLTFSWDESHHEQLFPLNSSQTTWWLIRFLGHVTSTNTSVWHEFWVTFWFWPSPRFSISNRFLAKVTDLRLRFKVAWHTDRRLAFISLTSSKAQNQLKKAANHKALLCSLHRYRSLANTKNWSLLSAFLGNCLTHSKREIAQGDMVGERGAPARLHTRWLLKERRGWKHR